MMRRMKIIARALVCGLVLAVPAFAQDVLQDKLDKKLAKDFIKKVDWEQDYAAAKKNAAAGNKLILAYFTRSYAP